MTTQTQDECAWLIERKQPHGAPPLYLMVAGTTGSNPSGRLQWDANHQWALRFARRADATLFLGVMFTLTPELPCRVAVEGFRPGDEPPYVAEHMWTLTAREPGVTGKGEG